MELHPHAKIGRREVTHFAFYIKETGEAIAGWRVTESIGFEGCMGFDNARIH
jgi:hypothetical protein